MSEEQTIATGYEAVASQLSQHIYWYKAKDLVEHNGSFLNQSLDVNQKEARQYAEAFEAGTLETVLAARDDFPFCAWYVQEAIKDFFEKDLHKPNEER